MKKREGREWRWSMMKHSNNKVGRPTYMRRWVTKAPQWTKDPTLKTQQTLWGRQKGHQQEGVKSFGGQGWNVSALQLRMEMLASEKRLRIGFVQQSNHVENKPRPYIILGCYYGDILWISKLSHTTTQQSKSTELNKKQAPCAEKFNLR